MPYHVLKETGHVIARSTVQPVTTVERKIESFLEKTMHFNSTIKDVLFSDKHVITNKNPQSPIVPIEQDQDYLLEYQNHVLNKTISPVKNSTIKYTTDTVGDPYLKCELAIPRIGYESPQLAKVTKRLKADNGDPVSTAHDNPLLDTRSYIVEYLDGHEEGMHANLIAEHMYSQVNENDGRNLLLNEITSHRCDEYKVVNVKDSFNKTNTNQLFRKHTTKG